MNELKFPLAQFQTQVADKHGTKRMVEALNRATGEVQLPDADLSEAFDLWFGRFEPAGCSSAALEQGQG